VTSFYDYCDEIEEAEKEEEEWNYIGLERKQLMS
jgi:hypothetical protein